MKIVIIGGTGRVGSQVVSALRERGHEAVAASPATGVDTLSGHGLPDALEGADVVVDVSNAPSFEDAAVMAFFTTSTRHLLEQEAAAGVTHHVALSVVGCDRLPDSGYLRAKVAQERLIRESPIPFTIVRATQFFEFVDSIAAAATVDGIARIPPVQFQPIAVGDVAREVCRLAETPPANDVMEIAGPEAFRFDELIRMALRARGDSRTVVPDPQGRYFGTLLGERSLVPLGAARLGEMRFQHWLEQPTYRER